MFKHPHIFFITRGFSYCIMAYSVSESVHLQAFLQCLASGETAYTIVYNALKSYETCFSEISMLFYRNLKLNECSLINSSRTDSSITFETEFVANCA